MPVVPAPGSSHTSVELVWRAGPFAIVWKGEGVSIADEKQDSGKGSRKGRGRDSNAQSAGRQRGSRGQSVCAWAADLLGGAWDPASTVTQRIAGLVLLVRSGLERPTSVRGVYSALVAPASVSPEAAREPAGSGAAEVQVLWESLGLCGGMDDDGASLVEEGPSGHFGRLGVVHFKGEFSPVFASSTGEVSQSPERRASEFDEAVGGLQELGFDIVRLPQASKASQRHSPQLLERGALAGTEALSGAFVCVVALQVPEVARRHPCSVGKDKIDPSGFVTVSLPKKFKMLMSSERSLAEQRLRTLGGGVVEFRGMALHVPEEQLCPRASSGALVDAALGVWEQRKAEVGDGPRVLDLGVGSGALLLAALREFGDCSTGHGVDIDAAAVQTCLANAERAFGGEWRSRVAAVQADFTEVDGPGTRDLLYKTGYDIILCNPPFRSEDQQAAYDRSTGNFGGNTEHSKTLVAGKTGLEMYEGVARCLARDFTDCSSGSRKGDAPLLRLGGTLIFQVEAGARGAAGGMAAVVGAAVESASQRRLRVRGVHVDERGLERAILVQHCVEAGV